MSEQSLRAQLRAEIVDRESKKPGLKGKIRAFCCHASTTLTKRECGENRSRTALLRAARFFRFDRYQKARTRLDHVRPILNRRCHYQS